MVDSTGNVLASHPGIHHYTIGQRRGLGIAAGNPQYVTEIDPINRVVRIGSNDDLMKRSMKVGRLNWLSISAPDEPLYGRVRIRYKHEESGAMIHPQEGSCLVEFEHQQRAITPGQAAVFFNGDLLLGGGWIEEVYN